MVLGMFIISIVDITKTNNVIQTTSVVPIETLSTPYVYGFMSFQLLLIGFPSGDCSVSQFYKNGLSEGAWHMTTSYANATCIVQYACSNCSLVGSNHVLQFEFNQKFAMASSIGYVITAPHYRGKNIVLSTTDVIVPANSSVFRGSISTGMY